MEKVRTKLAPWFDDDAIRNGANCQMNLFHLGQTKKRAILEHIAWYSPIMVRLVMFYNRKDQKNIFPIRVMQVKDNLPLNSNRTH